MKKRSLRDRWMQFIKSLNLQELEMLYDILTGIRGPDEARSGADVAKEWSRRIS